MVAYRLGCPRRQTSLNNSPFHQWIFPTGQIWASFYRSEHGYLLRFPELADFEISADGDKVFCHPTLDVTEETSQHLYLNQVLPLAQSMMGKLVFHGSAVDVGNQAVAFVAESGRGKSTLAASFASCGNRFLTDDGLEVEPYNGGYQVRPSHPSIRLWRDSEEALFEPGSQIAPALPFTSKSRFLAGPNIAFCPQALPLHRVYFMGRGDTSEMIRASVTGAESMIEWVRHSFLLDVDKRGLLASHFVRVSRLANQPIHFRLDYPRRFEQLSEVREAIVAHLCDEAVSS